jgi:hypothetical protein
MCAPLYSFPLNLVECQQRSPLTSFITTTRQMCSHNWSLALSCKNILNMLDIKNMWLEVHWKYDTVGFLIANTIIFLQLKCYNHFQIQYFTTVYSLFIRLDHILIAVFFSLHILNMCQNFYTSIKYLLSDYLQSVIKSVSCHSWYHLPLIPLITVISFERINAVSSLCYHSPHFSFKVFADSLLRLRPPSG